MKPSNHLIGVVGDLHFFPDIKDPGRWVSEYDRLGDWIVEEFKSRGIRWVVWMGDVFHGRVRQEREKSVDFQTLNGIVSFFQKFEDFENIIILGNHDCFHKETSDDNGLALFESWGNIRVVDEVPKYLYYPQSGEMGFEGEWDADELLPNSKFVFVPWGTDIKSIPDADAIFGHFDIQTFKYDAQRVSDHGFKSEQLFRRSKNVISGHYHHYQTRDYKKGNITYVGTPLQNNWGESGKDSFIFVFDAKECELVEKIENTFSPKHVKVALSDLLTKKVVAADVMPGNKVKLQIDVDVDSQKIAKFTENLGRLGMVGLEVDVVANQDFDIVEYTDQAATLDYREQFVSYIEDMNTPNPDKVKEKGLFYYDEA